MSDDEPLRVCRALLVRSQGVASALLQEVRELHNEIDCRIEHGAESGGHLEYVDRRLKRILRIYE